MKKDKILTWIIIICVVCLVAIIGGNVISQISKREYYSRLLTEQKLREEEERQRNSITLLGGNIVQMDKLPTYDILLTPEECLAGVSKNSTYNRYVTINAKLNLEQGNNLLVYFEAFSSSECNKINVELSSSSKNETVTFYVQTQVHGYYIPINNFARIENIKFSITEGNGGVTVRNVEVVNAYQNEIPNEYYGSVNISEDCENIAIADKSGISVTNAQDIVCDEEYAYIGNIDNVYIATLSEPENPKIVSSISGLGTVRRLEFANDGQTLVVASREYGVYLINIKNPQNPIIVGHIDTLELASGVDVVGDYLFIASRYYGIEIYDITNPANPKFCSSVKSNNESECIDCTVYGDYLYAGVWATRRIEVFDISDISDPKYVEYIETDGNAYGLDVYEDQLIVSTGFHSGINSYNSATDYGYGTGNGLSIYSLKNPEIPVLLSTVKSDNRYYYIGMDYWNVRVSDGYAFFSDLYSGLYIYDIKDGKNPVRVAKITVPIKNGSASYVDMTDEKYVYGFNTQDLVMSPITGVGISNGYIYIANTLSDVFSLKFEQASEIQSKSYDFRNSGSYCYSGTDYSNGMILVEDYRLDGQTYVIEQTGDYIFAGTSYGIQIFDTNMNKVSFYKTSDAVRDFKIVKDKLYTAEGLNGISIYKIDGSTLTLLGNYIPKEVNRHNVCSQIGVSPDGNYVITSCRLNLTVMLDVSNPDSIFIEKYLKSGAVYYRNIADGYVNNSIYISHAAGVSEIIFNNDGSYTYNEFANTKYFYSSAGFAALDDNRILAVCRKGYQLLDVSNGFRNVKESELILLGNSVLLKGSPSVNNNIMCVAFPAGGQITILDISNVGQPVVKANFKIKGCPDTAFISDDGVIYVPCRYEGIKRITLY